MVKGIFECPMSDCPVLVEGDMDSELECLLCEVTMRPFVPITAVELEAVPA